jgi:hypothetical protein
VIPIPVQLICCLYDIQIANETGGQVFFLTPQQVDAASTLPGLLVGTNAVNVLSVRDAVVSGSSSLDMSRFRFVQAGGRDGHDGLFPIPGLPVAEATGTADAVLTGSFSAPQFDLRRADGDHIQDVSLAPVANDLPGEFVGPVNLPSEPFLGYVTGQDAGGHTFQRVLPKLIQPQSVAIVPPIRQDLHPGEATTYSFAVMNLGDVGTFDLDATDDKGFLVSADPPRADIPANGSANLTVVLQPPANVAPGRSDALTVRAESVGTPGLQNFAALTSVVVLPEPASSSTTSTTSTTSPASTTTTMPSASTTTTTLSSPTTTTLPCTTPRCTIDAALRGAECGDEIVPSGIRKKLDRATSLIDGAASDPPKKARRLLKQATHQLKVVGKAAGKAAKGKKPKLTKDCAAAIQRATGTVASGLQR